MERGANEFMNNHGKRFGKLETSGRHISQKDFKIKAASIITKNTFITLRANWGTFKQPCINICLKGVQ